MSDASIFPERRTRSQLVLPDDILQVPQRSPMKHARTVIRAQANVDDGISTAVTYSEGPENELLLSPRTETHQGRKSGGSKRSVSPEPEDEYLRASGSSSDGRELKRVKRDVLEKNGDGKAIDNGLSRHVMQRLAAGHACNNSESNTLDAKQFMRKRSSTVSKKPNSTASAGIPLSVCSPTVSLKKGRSQSVPLFPLTNDIPRIDFKNLPPTPNRSRSPSRSPTRQKLRIIPSSFPKSSSLPTIHDELPDGMAIPESPCSVPEERELRILELLEAKSSFEENIKPPMTSTSLQTTEILAPATPMTQSLNKLIPMSPLTPIFETPCPVQNTSDVDIVDRYDMKMKWDAHLHIEVSLFILRMLASQSTIRGKLPDPRLRMVRAAAVFQDLWPLLPIFFPVW